MCIRFTGFQARVIFFYIKKYIEFNTVANLIRLHSYGRRVSRMTDELLNVSNTAERVRERPFDFNERAGRGARRCLRVWSCFFCDAILSFYSPLIQNVL